jgi:hypothetical protein
MNKSMTIVFAALVAASAAHAFAQTSQPSPATRAEAFRLQNQFLERESTPMPAGSPAVDRYAKPEDPMPKATTLAQEEARFRIEDRQLQAEATSLPVGSPSVNRTERAADPIPAPTTNAQKAAASIAEERSLQQESTK